MSSSWRVPACVVLLILIAGAATALDLAGRWAGAIQLPSGPLEIRLVFHTEEGSPPSGTISIPAQGAENLPLAGIAVDGDRVSFRISEIPGEPGFAGTLADDVLSGTFSQSGATFPFELRRAEDRAAVARAALEGLRPQLERALEDFGVPGLALGVVVDGEVVLLEGFGLRDVEAGLPVTPDTLFAIGSSSKAFTTMVLGTLVDEGLVEWDRPVRSFIPELRMFDEHATANLTVRDLVTHRSGLPRHDASWYNADLPRPELVARLEFLEPFADIRERFHYQNLMFLTAGHLVERVTGKSWEENVRERVFEPLGMSRSNFSVDTSQGTDDYSLPYLSDAGKTRRIPFRNIDAVGPAGSINSSARDMVRWLQLHLGGGEVDGSRLVQGPTLREMHTPQVVVGGYPEPDDRTLLQCYGLGWFIESYRGRYLVHHGGAIDGFIAMVSFMPREGIGVVTLTNASGVRLAPLVDRVVADRLLGEADHDWLGEALARRRTAEAAQAEASAAKDSLRVAGTSPSHPLAGYAGEYAHPGYGTAVVELVDGALRLTYNRMSGPLEHWHYDVFEVPDDGTPGLGGVRVQFRSDMDGRVAAMVSPLEPEVSPIVFERLPDRRLRDPEYLARFAGSYELPNQTVTVTVRGERLELEVPGQPPYALEPVEGTTFRFEALSGFSITFVEEDGRVTAARFNQPNGVFTAPQAPR